MKKQIIALLLCSTAFFAQAQSEANSVQDTALSTYLLDLMHRHYDHRREVLAHSLQRPERFELYRQRAAQRYRRLLGDFPDSLLHALPVADTIGTIRQDGYRVERLILDRKIPVNLYLPDGDSCKPAVLFFCGHEQSGKSADSYQRTARLFAQNGFVVLVADPVSQGERVQLLDSQGKPQVARATSEHTLLNASASLVGWGVLQEELADNLLCMNYLRSLSEVDTDRIGCLGNSGGGAQNTFFAALDGRIKATACCSFFTRRERMLQKFGADDGCQNLWGETAAELELADYYLMQAPRPTLILAGRQDFMDFAGAEAAFAELQKAYRLLDKEDNIEMLSVDDGHGISQPKRERAVRFFRKHLLGDDSEIRETDFAPLPDSLLRCTRSGQIALDYPDEPTFSARMRKRGEFTTDFSPKKLTVKTGNQTLIFEPTADIARDRSAGYKALRRLLNIPDTLPPIGYKKTGKTLENEKITVETFIISRENEPDLTVMLLLPKKSQNIKTVEIIGSTLRTEEFDPFNYGLYVNKNRAVLIAFVRSEIDPARNNKKFYNDDYRVSALSLMLGKPLIGQQLIDECSAADFACRRLKIRHTAIVNNNRLWRLYSLYGNWNSILKKPVQKNKLHLVVPGVLR